MNFDFSHLKAPPFPKLILFHGPGMGKTTIRRLLAEQYREQNILCALAYTVAELTLVNKGMALIQSKHLPELERKENLEGVIFLELPDTVISSLPFTPTYTIYFPDHPVVDQQ